MSDLTSFAAALATNLVLTGAVIAGALILAFRVSRSMEPRLRYWIAVVAFILAVAIPPISMIPSTATGASEAVALTEPSGDFTAAAPGMPEARPTVGHLLDEFSFTFSRSPVGGVFLTIWLLGIAILLFRETAGHVQLYFLRRRLRSASEIERVSLKCSQDTRLYFSDRGPYTVGFIYPVIVFPELEYSDLNRESLQLILRHEVDHARWRDPMVKAFTRLVRAVFWICPTVWIINRLIETECEVAADKAAVASLASSGEGDVLFYAETLAAAAEGFDQANWNAIDRRVAALSRNKSTLELRISRLVSLPERSRVRTGLATAVLVGSLVVLALTPVASPNTRDHDRLALADVDLAIADHSPESGKEFPNESDPGGFPNVSERSVATPRFFNNAQYRNDRGKRRSKSSTADRKYQSLGPLTGNFSPLSGLKKLKDDLRPLSSLE